MVAGKGWGSHPQPLINLILQDKTWAEFSTLDVGVYVCAMQMPSREKQPNLNLRTQPKQTFGSVP